jgi:uncharacterized protein (TIGR00255 family)
MTLKSMTGFAQAVRRNQSIQVKAEVRTVNHRFAEFNLRIPREVFVIEEPIRAVLSKHIQRGRCDLYLSIDNLKPAASEVDVNWPLFEVLQQTEMEAKRRVHTGALDTFAAQSIAQWLMYPEVLQVRAKSIVIEEIRQELLQTIEDAVNDLVKMRTREGERLREDLQQKLDELDQIVQRMAEQSPVAEAHARFRMEERLREWAHEVDSQRLASEFAVMADRMSIDEELVRLRSHLTEFRNSLSGGSPIGRRLDFIVQELHREINTIGSKSADYMISKAVVDGKTVIEQLREQTQNIE